MPFFAIVLCQPSLLYAGPWRPAEVPHVRLWTRGGYRRPKVCMRLEDGFNGRPGWAGVSLGLEEGEGRAGAPGGHPALTLQQCAVLEAMRLVPRDGPLDPSAAQPCCGAAVPRQPRALCWALCLSCVRLLCSALLLTPSSLTNLSWFE